MAGALLTVAVTGAALLAAGCSRAPVVPASPAGGTSAVRQSTRPEPPRPADPAYAACLRAHGVASFTYPSASGVAVTPAGAGADLSSLQLSVAERACAG